MLSINYFFIFYQLNNDDFCNKLNELQSNNTGEICDPIFGNTFNIDSQYQMTFRICDTFYEGYLSKMNSDNCFGENYELIDHKLKYYVDFTEIKANHFSMIFHNVKSLVNMINVIN